MSSRECIVDVGSASVGVAFVDENVGQPLLNQTARTAISAGTEEAKSALPERTLQAIQKALEPHVRTTPPQHVRIVLASPWYDAKIRTITTKSERPVRVNTDTVVRTMKQYFTQKNEATPQGRTLIESIVSQAFVNGYPTTLKEPLLGTSLRVNHYAAEADTAFTVKITDIVKKVFPHSKVSFHSFAFVAFSAIRMLRDEENFIIIDAGGEITDVGVAHHDGFRFIGTFPVGTQGIVRAISQGGSMADTGSRLTLYARNELSTEESAIINSRLSAGGEEWRKQFRTILETAAGDVAIPQTTFLFADPQELPWLNEVVSQTHGSFSIRATLITPDFFQPHVTLEEESFYDSFLCAAALYFHSSRGRLLELQ